MDMEEMIAQDRHDSRAAYEQMTPPERDRYNALIARLDDMLVERKSKDRRQQSMCIAFEDRRVADRRK